ncbi:hypothetical protein EG327_003679 [Venturia inaequalis]|uniref:Uncharacterized protein n=1 Tax=Venturia inaequalis TaxID=5025 RepID=A0A8H3ZBU7_VENIN|nr:hypothetical protein EG327_003679 [Venturia inaequalis]
MDPTGLLTLPREIRQQILFSTYAFPYIEELTWRSRIEEFEKLTRWVIALRNVHPTITEDIQHVAKEWRKQLQILTQEIIKRIEAEPRNSEHLLEAWKLEDAEKIEFGITPGPVHFRTLCIDRQLKVLDDFSQEITDTTDIESYKYKRPERDHENTIASLLLKYGNSASDVRSARFFFIRDRRRRRHDQGQERDLEFYRMDKWADRLIQVHEGLSEDMVFVQQKWREAFEKEIREISKWRKELSLKLKEKEREFGLRNRT